MILISARRYNDTEAKFCDRIVIVNYWSYKQEIDYDFGNRFQLSFCRESGSRQTSIIKYCVARTHYFDLSSARNDGIYRAFQNGG